MTRFCFLILLIFVPLSVQANDNRSTEFARKCLFRLDTDSRTIPGDSPLWFFNKREIVQLSLGNFWEKDWEKITRNQSNPVPSMIEFHELLQQKGIPLLIVPIPAKATIYPEKFLTNFSPGDAPSLSPFIDELRDKGLNVIDLEPYFISDRKTKACGKLWCAQDAHYSPMACVSVADLIAETLEKGLGVERIVNPALSRSKPQEIKVTGDLVKHTEWEGRCEKESLTVQYVGDPAQPIESNIDSPILLLGDSHTFVFSSPSADFHCDGAGLFDHLSSAMGQAVDLEGNPAGGLVYARQNLLRKSMANPGYWDKKKAVVWVFTAREFTQCRKAFISLPIERQN